MKPITNTVIVHRIQRLLTDDLRRKPYKGNENKLAGHCYVASEVLAVLLGRKWKPCLVRHEGAPHWFLRNTRTGEVVDATANQFYDPVPYDKGRGIGFMTKQPSARAKLLLSKYYEQYPKV